MQYPEPIAKLIDSYLKLPGIGEKTATRLAFFTIDMEQSEVVAFSKHWSQLKKISVTVASVAISRKMIRV